MQSVTSRARRAVLGYAQRAAFVAAALCLAATGAAADVLERGREVYAEHCERCHGPGGRGDGESAKKSGFRARDMTRGSYKCRCTESGEIPTDDDLIRTVTNGFPGSAMLSFRKKLSADEIVAVVQHIKTFSPKFAQGEAPDCIAIPEPPPPTTALVEEGEHVYRLLGCWNCHGPAGRGDGPAAKGLKDDWGDRVKAYNFARRNRFRCGGEPSDIYRTLHTGMNGSPMPSYAAVLAFGPEIGADLSAVEEAFDAAAAPRLSAYLAEQPASAEIVAMTDGGLQALIEHRTWALVYYLRSLAGADDVAAAD